MADFIEIVGFPEVDSSRNDYLRIQATSMTVLSRYGDAPIVHNSNIDTTNNNNNNDNSNSMNTAKKKSTTLDLVMKAPKRGFQSPAAKIFESFVQQQNHSRDDNNRNNNPTNKKIRNNNNNNNNNNNSNNYSDPPNPTIQSIEHSSKGGKLPLCMWVKRVGYCIRDKEKDKDKGTLNHINKTEENNNNNNNDNSNSTNSENISNNNSISSSDESKFLQNSDIFPSCPFRHYYLDSKEEERYTQLRERKQKVCN